MRRRKRCFKGVLACVLSVLMIFTALPIVSRAEAAETAVDASAQASSADTSSQPYIVGELTEKRDENTKYFRMSDGSVKACVYPQAVHYEQNGEFLEIDNTLTEQTENGKTFYRNKANSVNISLPESISDGYVEFSDEKGFVKFKLLDAENKKLKNKALGKLDKSDKTVAENINSRAVYESVKADVDVEYDISGTMLKETIVLNKKTDRSFTFEVVTSATSAALNNDNSVSFFGADGSIVYTVAAPYMTDAAGEYSNDVAAVLKRTDSGYLLTYTPSYEWLSQTEREYPVKIDPTLVKAAASASKDTFIYNSQNSASDSMRGSYSVINVGMRTSQIYSGEHLTMRGLVEVDIPTEIGKNDCIVDARLIFIHNPDEGNTNNGIQIDVHELTASFDEGSTWWGNQPSYDSVITDYAIVNTENTLNGTAFSYDSYNITRLVNKWHNGAANYGVLLKLHDENAAISSKQEVFYYSKESKYYGDISKFFEVTYRNTTGLEDYWSYTTQDFGRYGTGYVNNYNGNLVYVHDDTSFNSGINGFTLSHVYNTALSGDGEGRYGAGWRLNLVQRFEPVTLDGNSSVKYKYTDGDGTQHYFVQRSDGSIVDEDGLGLTFTDIDDGELQYQLTDKNGNILKFDMWYYLRRIIDPNGNTINLNYAPIPGVDNYLASITTSSGGNFYLSYDSSYKLTSITDNAGRVTEFTRENGNLTQIKYPDGTVLKFEYCSGVAGVSASTHWLHGATAPDNSQIKYGNYGETGRIYASKYFATDGTESTGQYYYYDYNQTRVVDSYNMGTANERQITYQFDTFGRATCVYDSNGNIYSQTYTDTTSGTNIFQNNKTALASNGAVYVNNLLTNAVFSNGLDNWGIHKISQNSQFLVVSDQALLTSNSVKITNNSNTIEVIAQAPTIGSERTYTFSGYIKTEDVQSATHGAGIEVVTSGPNWYYSDFITGTTDESIDNGFQHVSVTVTLAADETITRVTAGLYNASGTVWIDSLQLETGDTANPINLIDNSSFERNSGSDSVPSGYSPQFTAVGGDNSAWAQGLIYGRDGNYSYRIVGESDKNKYVLQNTSTCGDKGDTIVFGGWAKANSVPENNGRSYMKMVLRILYTDGTFEWVDLFYNLNISDWQYAMKATVAKKAFSSIEWYVGYYKNCNQAFFDSVFLYRDTAQSYTYDSNGNVVSTSDYASQSAAYNYTNNNLSKLINPTGSSYEYLYNSENNLIASRSSEGLQYDISYDSYGNSIGASVGGGVYSSALESGKSYYIRLKGSGKYLTVAGASTANVANVEQAVFEGTANQRWKIEDAGGGAYYLYPEHSPDKGLDITNGLDNQNSNVAIYTHNTSDTQKFVLAPQKDYTYTITPKCTADGKILTVNFSSEQNNVTIITPQGANNADQEWCFEPVENPPASEIEDGAVYQLRARHSGKYIDLCNGGTTVGTVIQQYEENYAEAQKFRIERYDDTYYTIIPIKAQTLAVSVSSTLTDYGCEIVELAENNGADNMLFSFTYDSDKQAFRISPKSNPDECLDVPYSSIANCANLITAENGTSYNKYFILEKLTDAIVTSATYQDNGNYPATVTDSRGNTTSYTYDTARGLQTGVTDAKGNTVSYTYNSLNDRLESVAAGESTVGYQYNTVGSLKQITSPSGTQYSFTYDAFGRQSEIAVGNQTLSSITYRDNYASLVSKFEYGNGAYKEYSYDGQDRVISESINGAQSRAYLYDKLGNTAQISDLLSGVTTKFAYDLIGRITGVSMSDGQRLNYIYDSYNRVSLSKWSLNDISLATGYIYGDGSVSGQKTGLIYGVNLNGTQKLSYSYDELARLNSRTVNTAAPFVTEYGYLEGATEGTTTTLVKTVKNGNDTLEYAYDEVGNITQIKKNGTVTETYTYDSLNQLATACYGGDTYAYTYDNGGNIQSVTKNGEVIKTYGYTDENWKDKLTSFNGQTITYDAIGNPINYRDGMSFTWSNGRQLTGISQNGTAFASYTYNADGLRTSKTIGDVTTYYYWINGILQGQKTGDEYILFLYDENGAAYGFLLKNGATEQYYYYIYNLQGDVTGIIDSSGNTVVEYSYGAWGDILSVSGSLADTVGQKNPLRYRGYYYDTETGFYYLQSRYYDPQVQRFVNADGYVSTGQDILGFNMYAYCGNNPINRADYSGSCWYDAKGNWCHDNWEYIGGYVRKEDPRKIQEEINKISLFAKTKNKNNFTPRKDKRKGSDSRQKSGLRERNVAHPNGEEHSRVAKGSNNIKRIDSSYFYNYIDDFAVVISSGIAIGYLVSNDATIVGVLDDALIYPIISFLEGSVLNYAQ